MIGEPLCCQTPAEPSYKARSRRVRWQKEYYCQGYDCSTASEEEEQ
ncbi:MAG: hypothetical protein ABR985_07640 [Methanotrichaceae archaeon]|jgi:hypothetical protein